MTFSGNLYGVVLNDQAERDRLAPAFDQPPYGAPPSAPVVYMKPRSALSKGTTKIRADEPVIAASTIAMLFARDATLRSPFDALDCVGAVALALDMTLPQANYYRPAMGQTIRDGFLALGDWMPWSSVPDIETLVDGSPCHYWQLNRLVRSPDQLIADLSAFMTLRAGDVLLVGLSGDAPSVRAGQTVTVRSKDLPPLTVNIEETVS